VLKEPLGVGAGTAAGIENRESRDVGEQGERCRALVVGVVRLGVDFGGVGIGQLFVGVQRQGSASGVRHTLVGIFPMWHAKVARLRPEIYSRIYRNSMNTTSPQPVILVLADFGGAANDPPTPVTPRRFLDVTSSSLPQILRRLRERARDQAAFDSDPNGSWCGLGMLAEAANRLGCSMPIKIWNLTKRELLRDLRRAPDSASSALFKKAYLQHQGTFGQNPIGFIIADFELTGAAGDAELAGRILPVASACGAPLLLSVAQDFLCGATWSELAKVAHWRAVCEMQESKYLFTFVPQWRAKPEAPHKTIHPGYLVARSALPAFVAPTFFDLANRLLSREEIVPAALPPLPDGSPDEAETEEALRSLGLNAWIPSRMQDVKSLRRHVPARRFARPDCSDSIQSLLLTSRLTYELQDYVRRAHGSAGGRQSLEHRIVQWMDDVGSPRAGSRRGPIEPWVSLRGGAVEISKGRVRLALDWHREIDGGATEIEVYLPG
jgi:hypothetical protein